LFDTVIEEVLTYPVLKNKQSSNEEINNLYDFIMEKSFELYEHSNRLKHSKVKIRDKHDEKILQSVVESGCDIFITGDKDFLDLQQSRCEILTPKAFVEKFFLYI
jgi:putative PIN family toxin of toxin-antitoxin system